MKTFWAHQFQRDAGAFTGYKALFLAPNIKKAVESVLYSAKLRNGGAFIGPSGRVVHDGASGYVICRQFKPREGKKATTPRPNA